MSGKPKAIRCAIYTRKSSEEGLEQDYNSLHAQRDACEAYVRSQTGEGWTCLKTAYDDGGISGGTMDRPGLKQLLSDIAAGRIDVVVVYKVDRLTRSLWDFAKIVEVFDAHGVSFVSVTQSFNTTSSMGRLTLNMLLSFAQFEREVTSERIRDKIAASKKKGMWMGGGVPLGYDAEGRTLKINEPEAKTVRHMFRRYLELRSTHALVAELKAQGVRSKLSTFSTGRQRGGEFIDRGAAYKLLSNPVYLGKVRHKDQVYDGLHPPILDQETFDAVQEILAANRVRRTTGSARRTQSRLIGKLFDADGHPMTPTFGYGRGGRKYRYYVSTGLQTGKTSRDEPGKIRRVPGPAIEQVVEHACRRFGAGLTFAAARLFTDRTELSFDVAGHVPDALGPVSALMVEGERAWSPNPGELVVSLPLRAAFRGGRVSISGQALSPTRRPDRTLVRALREAHKLMKTQGGVLEGHAPRTVQPLKSTYERRLANLACLAPDLQRAILDGDQSASLTLSRLLEGVPLSWADQRKLSGRHSDGLAR